MSAQELTYLFSEATSAPGLFACIHRNTGRLGLPIQTVDLQGCKSPSAHGWLAACLNYPSQPPSLSNKLQQLDYSLVDQPQCQNGNGSAE